MAGMRNLIEGRIPRCFEWFVLRVVLKLSQNGAGRTHARDTSKQIPV